MDVFYTLNELAKFLRINPSTVWRMRRRGDLHAVKIGGRVLVPECEVDRLLREGEELGKLSHTTIEASQ